MGLIIRVLDAMDRMLVSAVEEGREPRNFVVRPEDWAEIQERHRYVPELAGVVSHESYRGVLVHTGALDDNTFAVLIDRTGTQLLG